MSWVMANQDEAGNIATHNLKLPFAVVSSMDMPRFGVEVAMSRVITN